MRRSQLVRRRLEIASEVPAQEAMAEVSQTVENEQPGEEEVPPSSCIQVGVTWNREPRRECPLDPLTIEVGGAQHSRGRDRERTDASDAFEVIAVFDSTDHHDGNV